MASEPDNSFYTEVPADQLTQTGKIQSEVTRQYIADKEAAHDIALVQEQEGMAAAQAREDYLKKTHEAGGHTPEQMENIKLMEGLQQQFPDSFDVITTRKGEQLLLSRPIPQQTIQRVYEEHKLMNITSRQLLTPHGFMSLNKDNPEMSKEAFDKLLTEADFSELTEELVKRKKLYDAHTYVSHPKTGGNIGVQVYSWQGKDLIDNKPLLEVKKTTFTEAGKAHLALQKDITPVAAENILDMFKQ